MKLEKLNGGLRESVAEANTVISEAARKAAQKQLDHERALNEVREAERWRADEQMAAAQDSARKAMLDLDAERQAVKRHEAAIERLQAEAKEQSDRNGRPEALLAAATAENQSLKEQIAILRESLSRVPAQPVEPQQKVAEAMRERPVRTRLRKHGPFH